MAGKPHIYERSWKRMSENNEKKWTLGRRDFLKGVGALGI